MSAEMEDQEYPEIIDLTEDTDDDVDIPSSETVAANNQENQLHHLPAESARLTEQECQERIVNLFPDIDRAHVLKLVSQSEGSDGRSVEWCERLIGTILDAGPYPKEREKANNQKRKRHDEDDDDLISKYIDSSRAYDRPSMEIASKLLQDRFTTIPATHIKATLDKDGTIFKAFDTLQTQIDNYTALSTKPYTQVHRRRPGIATRKHPSLSNPASMELLGELKEELSAAVMFHSRRHQKRKKEDDEKKAEEANLRAAQENNEMTECQCCFTEYPTNRMTYCNGDTVHFFCFECTQNYVKTELSMLRCRPKCFATEDCKESFSRAQLQAVLDEEDFTRLENLQQQDDIRAAGLGDLEECPFCDYKAECPPVEEYREFRCSNPTCGKTSCRLCRLETHVPLSCAELAKEKKLDVRHEMEEAMSKALIRSCNKCKVPFLKEDGCNKMSCTSCGNKQCYVCSKNITDYSHFDQGPGMGYRTPAGSGRGPKKCPLHDNTHARHVDEVQKAENEALQKLRQEHPELSEEDLKVDMSEKVKRDENKRQGRGGLLFGPPPPHNAGRWDPPAFMALQGNPVVMGAHAGYQVPALENPHAMMGVGHGVPRPGVPFGFYQPPQRNPVQAQPHQWGPQVDAFGAPLGHMHAAAPWGAPQPAAGAAAPNAQVQQGGMPAQGPAFPFGVQRNHPEQQQWLERQARIQELRARIINYEVHYEALARHHGHF